MNSIGTLGTAVIMCQPMHAALPLLDPDVGESCLTPYVLRARPCDANAHATLLLDRMSDRRKRRPSDRLGAAAGRAEGLERAALVGLVTGGARRIDAEHSLEELAGLADAAGARVVLRVLQERPKPDSATFLGSGKVDVLAQAAAEADVDLVIFDNELSPAQLRELQKRLDRKVVDRTQLILDIFARRARTREGKLQVELAQLKYLLPRLVGASAALSRLGGGIGTQGPWRNQARSGSPPHSRAHARRCRTKSTTSAGAARSCASAGRRSTCRPSRSSATPTPARRRCSTG